MHGKTSNKYFTFNLFLLSRILVNSFVAISFFFEMKEKLVTPTPKPESDGLPQGMRLQCCSTATKLIHPWATEKVIHRDDGATNVTEDPESVAKAGRRREGGNAAEFSF